MSDYADEASHEVDNDDLFDEDDAASLRSTVDLVYRSRSLGVASAGIPDQYADGTAAKVWEHYIGNSKQRTDKYRDFLVTLLRSRSGTTEFVLDAACGTGIDSVLLIENDFKVTSCDASDKMLKHAMIERWNRRKEPGFDDWVIEEANWLTLADDIDLPVDENGVRLGFDAVICLGNSFAHLPDTDGQLSSIRLALNNFERMLRPGGVLLIDHRNYDQILDSGYAPITNIFYTGESVRRIDTKVIYVNGRPQFVRLDYTMDMSEVQAMQRRNRIPQSRRYRGPPISRFHLSYYPHRLDSFRDLLRCAFGSGSTYKVYGDFNEITEDSTGTLIVPRGDDAPGFFIHVVIKSADE